MKAFLLAAGLGTRLRPITNKIPKCLVKIHNQPLLYYWLKLCEKYGVNEVIINLHYLPEKVKECLEKNQTAVRLKTVYEEELFGSGGTIFKNKDFVKGEESFFIFYADNLTNVNLDKIKSFHKTHNGFLTMGLFMTNSPENCGIAELDGNKRIIDFVEKPKKPKSNLANAGIYLARQEIFSFFPNDNKLIDFGVDILPKLVNKMYGYLISEYLIDIGTMENYEKAQKEWKGL